MIEVTIGSSAVPCPSCGVHLALPGGCGRYKVRCPQCKYKFRLQIREKDPTDEDIATWLMTGRSRDAEEPAAAMAPSATIAGVPVSELDAPSGGDASQAAVATDENIHLAKIDRRGALFEFPAARLKDAGFRCAMPRRCLGCGTMRHLSAHVVIYSAHMVDSVSLEDEHNAGALQFSTAEAQNLSCREILERLPRVPNAPSPADLPMPYWICDMCSGAGTISGQVRANTETGTGTCRLRIRNLRRAEEFLINAGGEGSRAHRSLQERIAATAENPWEALPEVVQHRLQQWFRPQKNERFIAYVPDRDRSRTEDGMAGLVVSNRRLIYHTQMRHGEVKATTPLELQLAMSGGTGHLRIKTPQWVLKNVTLDRLGVESLRKALVAGKFQTTWR